MRVELGDCREVLKMLADASVDSVVTDPPYELGFMGKAWDSSGVAYDVNLWREVLRVLKPGGHLLAFGGSRTYHRLACAVEDAGFEIRDQIMWVYGSGFPKSLDVSKAIDKAAGADRTEAICKSARHGGGVAFAEGQGGFDTEVQMLYAPATDAARRWSGWGTALKPAHEPIVVARKPLIGTVAENVLAYGTGAINVDGCRVPSEERKPVTGFANSNLLKRNAQANDRPWMLAADPDASGAVQPHQLGRWPANLIHDGSAEVVERFPQTGISAGGSRGISAAPSAYGERMRAMPELGALGYGDTGSAARFFYTAKADATDRDQGLEGFAAKSNMRVNAPRESEAAKFDTARGNHHPTVKPTDLMRYLCRLVTPPGGIVLDPFMGSGSTGKAAALERFDFIGIELDPEYLEIARARIAWLGETVTGTSPAPRQAEPARGVQLDLRMFA